MAAADIAPTVLCLAEMNASFLMERAVQIIRQQPKVSLCRDRYSTNETVIERLIALGYEVESLENTPLFPQVPTNPKRKISTIPNVTRKPAPVTSSNGRTTWRKREEITGRSEAGEITVYAKIGKQEITFCYVENVTEAGRNVHRSHPFTRSEVGEAGRA